jgi:hypothetical protein
LGAGARHVAAKPSESHDFVATLDQGSVEELNNYPEHELPVRSVVPSSQATIARCHGWLDIINPQATSIVLVIPGCRDASTGTSKLARLGERVNSRRMPCPLAQPAST